MHSDISATAVHTRTEHAPMRPTDEQEILGQIVVEILQAGQVVNNKAIIGQLLKRLEAESDVVALDVYRTALEWIVHRTADDIVG
ncbi:hypothetical protein CIG19_15885 [Enterobacterales bacterium CwR94]|nr:hypothetical protein CIG19_15885 [Enterobacterales bacterium CwR94]